MRKAVELTISGQPITKKNSQRLIYAKGRIIPIPSSAYKTYEAMALRQLYVQYDGEPIDFPVNLSCHFFLGRKRKCDITNLLQSVQDILVRANVIADDNYTIVARLDHCKVDFDKENPRCEITLTELLPFEE